MASTDDLLDVVRSDLRFLRDEWDEDVSDDSLRRTSPVLRRLLVEHDLQRAWKAAGREREPQLEASTLERIRGEIPPHKIVFAAAGGAKYHGAMLRGVLVRNYAVPRAEIRRRAKEGIPSKITGLRGFVEAPCVVVDGQFISRRVVIKYIANKIGGSHFDPKRGNDPEEQEYSLLDKSRHILLLEKPAVYFELLSAGQAIVASRDIQSLIT